MLSCVHVIATHPWCTCSRPKNKKKNNEKNPLSTWGLCFVDGVAVSVADVAPCGNWLSCRVEEVSVCSFIFFDNCYICSGVGGVLLHWLLHHRLAHWLLHHHWLAHWLLHHWLTHRCSHWLCHHWLAHWLLHHWLLNWISILINHRLLHWHRLHLYNKIF